LKKIPNREKNVLLLGARQTGKTTLLRHLSIDRYLSLANLQNQLDYMQDVGRLAREIESLALKLNNYPILKQESV
jgi:predicted AAA+ superfamily ATPase